MATLDQLNDSRKMLLRFINGVDRSERYALEMSVHFDELFPEDDVFQDFVVATSSYNHAGGEFLEDEESLTAVCKSILLRIDRLIRERTIELS